MSTTTTFSFVDSAKKIVFDAYNLLHGIDDRGLVRDGSDGKLPSKVERGHVIVAQDGSVLIKNVFTYGL
jgi:hypothetical protein